MATGQGGHGWQWPAWLATPRTLGHAILPCNVGGARVVLNAVSALKAPLTSFWYIRPFSQAAMAIATTIVIAIDMAVGMARLLACLLAYMLARFLLLLAACLLLTTRLARSLHAHRRTRSLLFRFTAHY